MPKRPITLFEGSGFLLLDRQVIALVLTVEDAMACAEQAQDIELANFVYSAARAPGAGTTVEFGL